MAETDPVIINIIANQRTLEKSLAASIRSTERATDKMNKMLGNVGAKTNVVPFKGAEQGIKAASAAAGQLSFQLNDIGTSLAGGASPFQVMMQQGSQVAQVFQGLRQTGGSMGRALVGAFASMLNPISLLSFAFIAATGYALQYFTTAEDGSEEAAKAAQKHLDALEKVTDKYKNAAPAAHAYVQELKRQREIADDVKVVEDELDRLSSQIREDLQGAFADLGDTVDELDLARALGPTGAAQAVESLRTKMLALIEAIEKGKNPALAMQAVLAELDKLHIAAPNAGFDKLATQIRNGVVPQLQTVIDQHKTILELQGKISGFSMPGAGGPLDLGPISGENRVKLLNESLGDAAGAIDSFVENVVQAESGGRADAKNPLSTATGAGQFIESTWLDMINKYFPEEAVGKSRAQILELRKDAELSRRAIRRYAEENARALQDSGETISEANLQLAHFLGAGGAKAILKAAPGTRAADVLPANVVAANRSILGGGATREDVLAYAQRRAKGPSTSRKEENKDLDEWLKLSQEELDMKNKQLDIDSQFWESDARRKAQLEEYKLVREGLTAAEKQYGEVTDEMRAKIEAAAHAQAFAGVAAEESAERVDAATKKAKENAKAWADLQQQFAGIATSAITGFIQDLRNGVDAGEAFNNMINKIIDSIIQMVVQMAVAKAIGGVFGGIGGGVPIGHGGGTVGMMHHNDGRKFHPAMWAGAPRFALGGVVGLRPGEVPIIAHKGEVIIPRTKVRTTANGGGGDSISNVLGDINIDMGGRGDVGADNQKALKFGKSLQKMIQAEMVAQSRPGGILRGGR